MKRVLSILLVFSMLLSLFPQSVFAEIDFVENQTIVTESHSSAEMDASNEKHTENSVEKDFVAGHSAEDERSDSGLNLEENRVEDTVEAAEDEESPVPVEGSTLVETEESPVEGELAPVEGKESLSEGEEVPSEEEMSSEDADVPSENTEAPATESTDETVEQQKVEGTNNQDAESLGDTDIVPSSVDPKGWKVIVGGVFVDVSELSISAKNGIVKYELHVSEEALADAIEAGKYIDSIPKDGHTVSLYQGEKLLDGDVQATYTEETQGLHVFAFSYQLKDYPRIDKGELKINAVIKDKEYKVTLDLDDGSIYGGKTEYIVKHGEKLQLEYSPYMLYDGDTRKVFNYWDLDGSEFELDYHFISCPITLKAIYTDLDPMDGLGFDVHFGDKDFQGKYVTSTVSEEDGKKTEKFVVTVPNREIEKITPEGNVYEIDEVLYCRSDIAVLKK